MIGVTGSKLDECDQRERDDADVFTYPGGRGESPQHYPFCETNVLSEHERILVLAVVSEVERNKVILACSCSGSYRS